MAKYRLIKKYDNFKDFNKRYKNIKAEAGKILEKTKKTLFLPNSLLPLPCAMKPPRQLLTMNLFG